MSRKIVTLISFLITICFLAGPSLAAPKLGNAPCSRKGLIITTRHVYNLDNPSTPSLKLYVALPRDLTPVWTGDADAWLVIWGPPDTSEESPSELGSSDLDNSDQSNNIIKIQLTGMNSTYDSGFRPGRRERPFSVDPSELSGLPSGMYQMGLVLTAAGGDPTVLADWYDGFRSLISVTTVKIISTASGTGDESTTSDLGNQDAGGGSDDGSDASHLY
jgi:hypothetical protein